MESGKNNYLCPLCEPPAFPLPPPSGARIVHPRAAPRSTSPSGRANPENRILRKTQEVMYNTDRQDRLTKRFAGEARPRLRPVFEFLESKTKLLSPYTWTESSILAQDERWRRA